MHSTPYLYAYLLYTMLLAATLLLLLILGAVHYAYEFLSLIENEFTNIRKLLINSEAGGLEHPQVLSGILQELGLPSVQDVRLLNIPEQLELAESLRAEGT